MILRKLEQKDAELMLEWMHDASVVSDLKTNFETKTIEDCRQFIDNSISEADINYAIVDDADEYLGTVSLKHVDRDEETAEFAITIRKKAMGQGISILAMQEMINYGFEELGLRKIYWCVDKNNIRAVRFYDKNGFERVNVNNFSKHIDENYNVSEIENYRWYVAEKG